MVADGTAYSSDSTNSNFCRNASSTATSAGFVRGDEGV